jgi:hypothetical protein
MTPGRALVLEGSRNPIFDEFIQVLMTRVHFGPVHRLDQIFRKFASGEHLPVTSLRARSFEVDFNLERESLSQTNSQSVMAST